jgi:hypothetical protein
MYPPLDSLDGIYIYCINLDPDADEYVQDILGNQYTVIDHIESLPEKVPQLSMALTKKCPVKPVNKTRATTTHQPLKPMSRMRWP